MFWLKIHVLDPTNMALGDPKSLVSLPQTNVETQTRTGVTGFVDLLSVTLPPSLLPSDNCQAINMKCECHKAHFVPMSIR